MVGTAVCAGAEDRPPNVFVLVGTSKHHRADEDGPVRRKESGAEIPPNAYAPKGITAASLSANKNQRPFLPQQNLYFRPLLQGHGA